MRHLLLLLVLLPLAACTSASRIDGPAEFLGFRERTAFRAVIEDGGGACQELLRTRAENETLKKRLEEGEKSEPEPKAKPTVDVNIAPVEIELVPKAPSADVESPLVPAVARIADG